MQNSQDILRRYIDEMPAFSPATAKIVQLANNMNASANDIVSAIRLDPVLTGKVLQLVNSAYFGLAQPISSLNRALVYLGINTIKNLALSTAVMEAFESKSKDLAELIKPTWRHSLATAVCAKNIAKVAGVSQTEIEEYFIAGLLHDIGQIVLMQAFYSTDKNVVNLSPEQEKEKYGFDHSQVAVTILKKWKFSNGLTDAIGSYHSPSEDNRLSNFIHVADAMTYQLNLNGKSSENNSIIKLIAPASWSTLGLTESQVIEGLQDVSDQIEKAEIFLNVAGSKEKFAGEA